MTKAYLLGALHDATKHKKTYRLCQKSQLYVQFIAKGIRALGGKAWIYKEGEHRNVYIVEFVCSFLENVKILSLQDKVDYIRGYFDTDGGVAKSDTVRYYLYFCQKNYSDLTQVKHYLEELRIFTGKLHNPSKKVDPNYWRFYISTQSHLDFAKIIGSFHPEKKTYLRMKI